MTTRTWVVVYNTTDESLVVDEDGRTAYPREFTYAKRSAVKDLIDADKLVVSDMDGITDDSVPAARMAKQEAAKRNDDIEAEKAKDEPKPDDKPVAKAKPTSTSTR